MFWEIALGCCILFSFCVALCAISLARSSHDAERRASEIEQWEKGKRIKETTVWKASTQKY